MLDAYLNGALVRFIPVETRPSLALRALRKSHSAVLALGPWHFAAAVQAKPKDGRPNLYIVSPGTEYHADASSEFDHTLVTSAFRQDADELDFDVYYAVALDPSFDKEMRDENAIIMAAQETFTPGEQFDLSQIPGAAFLREINLTKVSDLDGFRRANGSLPRVVIVPAKVTLHLKPEASAEPAKPVGDSQPQD